MNWLTDYVKPRLSKVIRKRESPDNLWHKCKSCGQMIFHRDYVAALKVCSNCDFHDRIGPKDRFDALFDESRYELLKLPAVKDDPLKFRDTRRYTDRLKEARNASGDQDAVQLAKGSLGGVTSVIFVQNFFFMGGSMGMAVGEAIVRAAEEAIASKAPLILFSAAGGARMQEGILSLMQMPRTTVAVDMVKEAGLPYIVVLTDPTTGGVTASYAMLGDVHIAEPGALIGFAGQRVIEQTIREKLPEGFQRAEYLLDHGMVDMVVHRHEMRATLRRLVSLLMEKHRPVLNDAVQ
ncbi:acetyl-coenzyme A carboxylase carboxyl transferase subunit beta [alpha proteobacterium Q-1]|nr:acetyl-coenzyme A carboxylase carboxyl transferase subunit beta [alpha proteobacterium Q-1]